jgi:shikimate dehydrogenase
VLVNATALGLRGEDLPAELGLEPAALVVELVYGPEPTSLARWAEAAGARVVDGIEVLVCQGARSLDRWAAGPAPLDAMRRAARAV